MAEEKKYTKEQITKAIKYWSRALERMDEVEATKKSNAVVDGLIAEFGEDLVKSDQLNYRLNDADLKKIFDILNKTLFDSKLPKVKLRYIPEQLVINQMNDNLLMSEIFDTSYDSADCYGVYSAVCTDLHDSKGDTKDVVVDDDVIMINSSKLRKCIFIFAVAAICHEMIHYCDRFSREYHDLVLYASKTKTKLGDTHDDLVFELKMKEANENGIQVVKSFTAQDNYVDLNMKARYHLKSIIGENIENNNVVSKNDHTVIIRSKNSDKFFIAEFD